MSVAPSQPQPQPTLTPFGQFANGAISTAIALTATQPAFFAKTVIQSQDTNSAAAKMNIIARMKHALIQQHFATTGQAAPANAPFKARYLQGAWAGGCANAGSGALAEGLAFLVRDLGMNHFKPADGNLTTWQDFALSSGCGFLGAPVNTAAERIMYNQMTDNGRFLAHAKKIVAAEGPKGLFKGTAVCAGRDNVYNVGLFALNDAAKQALAPAIKDPLTRDTAAGMLAGAAAGATSYSFDVVKTRMQLDTAGRYPTGRATVARMLKEEGIRSLMDPKGVLARILTIGPLLAVTAVTKERVPRALPKGCFEAPKAQQTNTSKSDDVQMS